MAVVLVQIAGERKRIRTRRGHRVRAACVRSQADVSVPSSRLVVTITQVPCSGEHDSDAPLREKSHALFKGSFNLSPNYDVDEHRLEENTAQAHIIP